MKKAQIKEKPKLSFEEAKRMYVHRYTMEHIPSWAKNPVDNRKYYAPQYRTDKEWYDNTVFPPHNGFKDHCTSTNQSWPLGQWLENPYKKDLSLQP